MIDMQNSSDYRNIPISNVGIKNVKLPISYSDNALKSCINTVGVFSLYASLTKDKKGTHMSRFLSLLYSVSNQLSMNKLCELSTSLNKNLESENSFIQGCFTYFYKKEAPVSKIMGVIDIETTIEIENKAGNIQTMLSVAAPITSLCPCSKAISEYGAHSQRGIITITVWNSNLSIEDCIQVAEESASSPIFSLLKREDEKFVTEKAYNTPRFVEDLVRETAFSLKEKLNCQQFQVTAENFESIHTHNAWACVKSEDIQ
jgi:GTP cyclohydrolase I